MMVRFTKSISLLACLLYSAFPAISANAVEAQPVPQDYTAIYEVLRNGKALAKVTIKLSHESDTWTLHGHTHDMKGLANLLNIKGSQTTTGKLQKGAFIPEEYQYSFSVVGYSTAWKANFDWPSGVVTTSNKKGQTQLPLDGGAIDPFSLSLNISSHLAKNQPIMRINIVDENEIDRQDYQLEPYEQVDTALGCMDTTRVKRIHKNPKRTSLVWYADEHNYIPVAMQHAKKKGNDLKMQIISLDINGQLIQSAGPCTATAAATRTAALSQIPQ